jgi:hypothetical protein
MPSTQNPLATKPTKPQPSNLYELDTLEHMENPLEAPQQKKMDDGGTIPTHTTVGDVVLCVCCAEWFLCAFSTS